MKYAILTNDTIINHGTIAELWPNTSFSGGVPNADFLAEQGAVAIWSSIEYDPATQKLVTVAPYLLDGVAYDVEVVELTPEEIAAALEAKRAAMFCTPRQIRQALNRTGDLRQQVEAAVAAGDQDLKDWWEFSTIVERLHPQVVAMGDLLQQTPEQMDALFELAVTL